MIRVSIAEKDSVIRPGSIKSLSIPSLGMELVSKTIRPVRFVDKIQQASGSREPDTDTVRMAFLKVLHRGTFILYTFIDRLNRNHFFVETPDNFLELYEHYYSDAGGHQYSQPVARLNKQFEFVLKILMTPCRTIFSIVENIRLNENDLKGLFEVYDKCMQWKENE